jgi:hypothetical protein
MMRSALFPSLQLRNAVDLSAMSLIFCRPVLAAHLAADEAQNANPALALLSDLTTRFQGLKGAHNRGYTSGALQKDGTPLDMFELQNEGNNKTVEELLAELGPEEIWTLGKDEETDIQTLLKNAQGALNQPGTQDTEDQPDGGSTQHSKEHSLTAVDTSSFQPEPDSAPSSPSTRRPIDEEADETLQRLLDEIALDPTPDTVLDQADGDHEAGLSLPTAPEKDLDPPPPYCAGTCTQEDVDDALARRFASLGRPQPSNTDDALGLPSVPTGIKTYKPPPSSAPPEDEIDTWCIICLDDANLKCLGCDGDLYCTKCWIEGHRSEDAGYEERKHKAVEYVKGGGLKKQKARRMVGA